MVNEVKKRKRGRPPKKKAELPEFKSENEIREYVFTECFLLNYSKQLEAHVPKETLEKVKEFYKK